MTIAKNQAGNKRKKKGKVQCSVYSVMVLCALCISCIDSGGLPDIHHRGIRETTTTFALSDL